MCRRKNGNQKSENMAKKEKRQRRIRLHAAEKKRTRGKERMETDNLSGMWSIVLEDASFRKHYADRSHSDVYHVCT